MRTILFWLLSIGAIWLFFGGLYLLGKTGQLVRKGVETRKTLNKTDREAGCEELVANEEWYVFNRKSILWIIGPVLGWVGIYLALLLVLPLRVFLFSLFVLIVPALGYFGIFFVPSNLWERRYFDQGKADWSTSRSGGNNGYH